MNKRRGLASGVLAVVLCVTMALSGCSTAWVSEAEKIVAVLIPAAANVMALVASLQGGSVSAGDVQAIESAGSQATADLQLIQSLITEYQNADAQAQAGILNQIQTAITTAQSNLSTILPALHIKDAATQAKITAIVGVVLSEVQSLAAVLPLVNGQASSSVAVTRIGDAQHAAGIPTLAAQNAARVGQTVSLNPSVVKPPLTAREFVTSYNATMAAKTGNAVLDRMTPGLEIHQHGKFARWATAGLLK